MDFFLFLFLFLLFSIFLLGGGGGGWNRRSLDHVLMLSESQTIQVENRGGRATCDLEVRN